MDIATLVGSITASNFLILLTDRLINRGKHQASLVTHDQLDKILEDHPTRDQMDLKYVGLETEVRGLRRETRGLREDIRISQANRPLPPLPPEED